MLLTLTDIWCVLLETIWVCNMLLLNPSDAFAAGAPPKGFLDGFAHFIFNFLSLFLQQSFFLSCFLSMFLFLALDCQELALKVIDPCLCSLEFLLKYDDLMLMTSDELLSDLFVLLICFRQFSIEFSTEVFL